ncbi:TLR adapter interacting with SLC15A4 on the lysosome [Lepisosteus oculatus]|uniref:TLR adapter interacting with SLC15A4 on the lysosome n=1 Tax=Lepisosteus oculatus TaxID=7918 RepID=UPI00371502EA
MLAEGFLRAIEYREDLSATAAACPRRPRPRPSKKSHQDSWEDLHGDFVILGAVREDTPSPEQDPCQSPKKTPPLGVPWTGGASSALGSAADGGPWGLELYRSWGCTSICKDYPDLQIGGDHVGDRGSPLSGPIGLGPNCEARLGPLLQSGDLEPLEALEPLPLRSGPQLPDWGAQERASGHGDTLADEGYLAMDSSIGLNREPLSNSMLNIYLETKLLEVYKQYLQDRLAKCASPSRALPSSFVQYNVQQLSLQLSQEQGLDAHRARSIVINYLSTRSSSSGQISSPVLRISNMEPRKFPEPAKKKPPPLVTGVLHTAL